MAARAVPVQADHHRVTLAGTRVGTVRPNQPSATPALEPPRPTRRRSSPARRSTRKPVHDRLERARDAVERYVGTEFLDGSLARIVGFAGDLEPANDELFGRRKADPDGWPTAAAIYYPEHPDFPAGNRLVLLPVRSYQVRDAPDLSAEELSTEKEAIAYETVLHEATHWLADASGLGAHLARHLPVGMNRFVQEGLAQLMVARIDPDHDIRSPTYPDEVDYVERALSTLGDGVRSADGVLLGALRAANPISWRWSTPCASATGESRSSSSIRRSTRTDSGETTWRLDRGACRLAVRGERQTTAGWGNALLTSIRRPVHDERRARDRVSTARAAPASSPSSRRPTASETTR